MLKKPKSKQKTVAEKVAELIAHPNQSGSDSENENDATAPKVIDFDEDEYEMPAEGTTDFRKRNVKLLSEQSSKYKGKIVSRKDFEQDEEDDEEDEEVQYEESDEEADEEEEDGENIEDDEAASDSEDNEEALQAFTKLLKKSQGTKAKVDKSKEAKEQDESNSDEDDEEEEETSLQDESNSDEDDGEEASLQDDSNSEEEEDEEEASDEDLSDNAESQEEPEVISSVNQKAEIQKGICVQNQLRIWERLLELRINSQKIISKVNQLPPASELKDLEAVSEKNKSVLQETCKQTQNLLSHLLSLQNSLFTQYPEVNQAMKESLKRPSPFESLGEEEPPLKQGNLYLEHRLDTFRSYRNEVLLKWDDRTKLLTPGAGSKKKSLDEDYDVIKKINNALNNKSLLIQKSQQLKNNTKTETELLPQNEDLSTNCNVYDDSDFYHQQLRELIEYKASTSANMSEITKQYVELQKLRQKMKKKVDTRASKGRKLRYVVHNKLINFMAPHDNSTWTDESKDELCKSLFV